MESSLTHDDPKRIGDYRLIARLGSGGMGTVYLGRSPGGRTVALKTMHADYAADPGFRTRFRLEVDAARVIGGEHGARVVDADPLAEVPWLATEYVLGPSLDDAVALCGGLPEEAARALGARLCVALAQLHSSGVVHRDLKPSNILIAATGPKLIDFGIARAAGDDRLTRTGTAAGTPAFMSPEQATGGEHGPAGDVFALAGVLVFALTGHGPFGGGQAADLLYRVRYADADLTGVPPGLRGVLESCFSKVPEERPGTVQLGSVLHQSSGEFADVLPDAVHAEILRRSTAVWEIRPSRIAAAEGGAVTDVSPRTDRDTRRRRVLAAGIGTLLTAGSGAAAWAWLRPEETVDRESASGRPAAGAAPKPYWKSTISGAEDTVTLFAEGYLMVSYDNGLTSLLLENGKQGTVNRVALDAALPVADGKRVYGIDPDDGGVSAINPKTVQFQGRITSGEGLGVTGFKLLGARSGLILATGTGQKVREGGKKKPHVSLILAIEAATGKERWRREVVAGEEEARVAASNDDVLAFVAEDSASAWGVSARTGEKIWARKLPQSVDGEDGEVQIFHRPGASQFHLGLGEIMAVRLADGDISWRFGSDRDTSRQKERTVFYSAPVLHDGVVYALEIGHGIVALDAESGRLLWDLETGWAADASYLSVPVPGKDYIYFPVDEGRWFAAVDRVKHREVWVFSGPDAASYTDLLADRESEKLIAVNGGTVLAFPLE